MSDSKFSWLGKPLIIIPACLLIDFFSFSPLLPNRAYSDTGASILRPSQASTQAYRFPLDTIDPTSASNPRGALTPSFRGENQLMIYTSSFGTTTGTNDAGLEAVVENGIITQMGQGDSAIPSNGFVISGHGSAAQWMSRFAKPGATVTVDAPGRTLLIQFTPAVYLYETDTAIRQAEGRQNNGSESYQRYLQQAKTCRAQLASMGAQTPLPEMATLSTQCQQAANRAFYVTIDPKPNEFRGVWIRPAGNNPEQVAKVIQSLKKAHIGNVFLETYFQGKTAYPSQVMAEYGLTEQHPQYKGGDPVQLWIQEAHKEGIKVHLWTQIFFAGNQRENIEQYGPILQKYPQWRNIQRPNWNIKTPVISNVEPGHYFLDPANPEVRVFLEKLLLEMVSRYDVDGLNLDYIRYPASATVNKPYYLGTTWGYTEQARQQFQSLIWEERKAAESKKLDALKRAGKPLPAVKSIASSSAKVPSVPPPPPSIDPKDLTPNDALWPRWVAWRKEQVSSFVKNISNKAHAIKPGLLMSAVIFPSSDSTYAQKLQDYPRWVHESDIQALTPIGLSTIPERMMQQCAKLRLQVQDKIPVYIGVFGLYNRNTPIELLQQIDAIHRAGMPGLVLFDWSRLNPTYEEALQEGPFRE